MNDLHIRNSPGKGRGVFASVDFKEGAIIKVCPVIPLSEEDFKKLKGTTLENYPFSWNGEGTCIVLGYGSLYNHSDTPNIAWVDWVDNVKIFYALRDIKKGEELFFNYNNKEYQF